MKQIKASVFPTYNLLSLEITFLPCRDILISVRSLQRSSITRRVDLAMSVWPPVRPFLRKLVSLGTIGKLVGK